MKIHASKRGTPSWTMAGRLLLIGAAAMLALGPGLALASPGAEEEDKEEASAPQGTVSSGFRLDGDLLFGYRIVDSDGRFAKYREDIDIDDGFRLLQGKMTFVPGGDEPAGWFDRIEIEGNGLFGDPYERWGLEVRKAGSYRLQVRNRSADYFNDLTGVHHAWDLTRTNTDVDLSVTPMENLEIWGSASRFRQSGVLDTVRDISRDEFEFHDVPLDQTGASWSFGARYRLDRTVFWADQEFRSFDDNGGFGSRGLNQGFAPDESFLTFFEQREVRSVRAPVSRAGVSTALLDSRLRLSGNFLISDQDMGFSFSRYWEGANFQERPVTVSQDAVGDLTREVRHGNLEALYRATDRVSVSLDYRRRSWEQDAESFNNLLEVFEDGGRTISPEEFAPSYDVTLDQVTVGAEIAPTDSLSVFAEIGLTNKDQEFDIVEDEETIETDTVAYKFGARVRPTRALDMEASYERGDIDDPFTRISPTESNALKVKARVRPGGGWQLSGTLTYRDRTNDVTSVDLQTLNWGVNATYNVTAERWLMVSYARMDYESTVPIVFRPFFGGSATGIADNTIDNDIITAVGEYRFGDEGPLTLLGRVAYVDSSSVLPTLGFTSAVRASPDHDLRYADWSLGLRVDLVENLFGQVSGRFVDYQEDTSLETDVDDYDARIVTIGFGVRF